MDDWSLGARWGWGAWISLGTGALLGGAEVLLLGLGHQLPPDFAEAGMVALTGVGLTSLLGGVYGLLAGAVHVVARGMAPHRAASLAVALVPAGLASLYVTPLALQVSTQGRTGAALVLMGLPLLFVVAGYYNARFLVSRWLVGKAPGGWVIGSSVVGAVLAGAGAAAAGGGGVGGDIAMSDERDAVVVTIGGLRAEDASSADLMPNLHTFALRGVWFDQAITTSTMPLPALGAAMTGVHPVQHGAIDDTHRLHPRLERVSTVLADEGWATALVASSATVSAASGLQEGFAHVDVPDGALPGMARLTAGRLLGTWWVAGADPRDGWEREDDETVSRALAVAREATRREQRPPVLLWVHLNGPVPPYKNAAVPRPGAGEEAWDPTRQAYRDAVQDTDTALGSLLQGLGDLALKQPVVAVLGTHGLMLGEHGVGTAPRGLYEPLVRVPLVVADPRMVGLQRDTQPVLGSRVNTQVRTMDVPRTVLAALSFEPPSTDRGVDLLAVAEGRWALTLARPLVGRSTANGWAVGLRSPAVKVIEDVQLEDAALFDLLGDPSEQRTLALDQAETLQDALNGLGPDRRAVQDVTEGVLDGYDAAVLRRVQAMRAGSLR